MVSAWTCKYPTGCSAIITNRIANLFALEILSPAGVRLANAALLVFSKQEAIQKADYIAGHRSLPEDWASIPPSLPSRRSSAA